MREHASQDSAGIYLGSEKRLRTHRTRLHSGTCPRRARPRIPASSARLQMLEYNARTQSSNTRWSDLRCAHPCSRELCFLTGRSQRTHDARRFGVGARGRGCTGCSSRNNWTYCLRQRAPQLALDVAFLARALASHSRRRPKGPLLNAVRPSRTAALEMANLQTAMWLEPAGASAENGTGERNGERHVIWKQAVCSERGTQRGGK